MTCGCRRAWVLAAALLAACAEAPWTLGPARVVDSPDALELVSDGWRFSLAKTDLQWHLARDGATVLRTTTADGRGLALRHDGAWLAGAAAGEVVATDCTRSPLPRPSTSGGDAPAACLSLPVRLDDGHVGALELQPFEAGVFVALALESPDDLDEVGWAFAMAEGEHWYGGGTQVNRTDRPWPLDAGAFEAAPYASMNASGVATPFWFSSRGAGLLYPSYDYRRVRVALPDDGRVLSMRTLRVPERVHEPFGGATALYAFADATPRDAYLRFLSLVPAGPGSLAPSAAAHALAAAEPPRPDMFERPVWTTWATFKNFIDQPKVQGFYDAVLAHGFPIGVLEIDDAWTTLRYGELRFDPVRFDDPAALVAHVHAAGSRVSLWVPPFVQRTAAPFPQADAAGWFVQAPGADGTTHTRTVRWWGSLGQETAGLVDFGDAGARAWFGDAVDAPRDDPGVDGFKFDAGEAEWFPPDGVADGGVTAASYCDAYAAWAVAHGAYELRAASFAQHLGPVVRMMDKDSTWDAGNGLASLVPTALALSVAGYPFVLADMIGGNAYGDTFPSAELFVRWVQLTAFLPLMQFSLVPWDERLAPDVPEITRRYVDVHQALVPRILALVDEALTTGDPIVRPLFWRWPDHAEAFEIADEFLLGDDLLVAPVLQPGATTRDVWLPPGRWEDRVNGGVYEGPTWRRGHPAPLQDIPSFERLP